MTKSYFSLRTLLVITLVYLPGVQVYALEDKDLQMACIKRFGKVELNLSWLIKHDPVVLGNNSLSATLLERCKKFVSAPFHLFAKQLFPVLK